MELFGWIVLLLVVGYVTLIYAFVAINGFGKYNIGGVDNPLWGKFLIILFLIPMYHLWNMLIEAAPFTVIFK